MKKKLKRENEKEFEKMKKENKITSAADKILYKSKLWSSSSYSIYTRF